MSRLQGHDRGTRLDDAAVAESVRNLCFLGVRGNTYPLDRAIDHMAANLSIPGGDGDIRDDNTAGAGGAAVMTAPCGAEVAPLDSDAPLPACPIPPTGDVAIAGSIECSNCHSPMAKGQSFCKRCGFYPALNMCVDVDHEAEAQAEGVVQPAKSHLEVWKSLIPPWGWVLIAGTAVLFAVSLAARLVVPEGPP